ncbi:hypothetical protein [Amycolatopsis jejuensis]|uniref:hypothetical protein n=1 Tax=Amycolatopsis jejuensis TaxID=330084 RepID=UPI0005255523|nr:hypothetical protein [Amycolatopsis jejuensis]
MIGFVGTSDTVERAQRAAESIGLGDRFVARAYRLTPEVVEPARELDQFCEVILFPGRIPHHLALRASGYEYRAALLYVAESSNDLYRTLIEYFRGPLPHPKPQRISIDMFDRDLVREVFDDLKLGAPKHVLPIDDIGGDWGDVNANVLDFHLRLLEAGEVDMCVTGLRSVHEALSERGVPNLRADHTVATYREALQRADLTSLTRRSQAQQLCVGCTAPIEDGTPEAAREAARLLADALGGAVGELSWDPGQPTVQLSRGDLEAAVAAHRAGEPTGFDVLDGTSVVVGFGVGLSVRDSSECARRALTMAVRSVSNCVTYSDGTVVVLGRAGKQRAHSLRSGDSGITGLGPTVVNRLLEIFRRVDPEAVSAAQLATEYGIRERSARRMLGQLVVAGLAERLGKEGAPGAGRPRTLYRVKVSRLAEGAD